MHLLPNGIDGFGPAGDIKFESVIFQGVDNGKGEVVDHVQAALFSELDLFGNFIEALVRQRIQGHEVLQDFNVIN